MHMPCTHEDPYICRGRSTSAVMFQLRKELFPILQLAHGTIPGWRHHNVSLPYSLTCICSMSQPGCDNSYQHHKLMPAALITQTLPHPKRAACCTTPSACTQWGSWPAVCVVMRATCMALQSAQLLQHPLKMGSWATSHPRPIGQVGVCLHCYCHAVGDSPTGLDMHTVCTAYGPNLVLHVSTESRPPLL